MKHHQQTFVWTKKKKKTIVLSCVGVFISCKHLYEIRSLSFNCFRFRGLREEGPQPCCSQSSAQPLPSPPFPPRNVSIGLRVKFEQRRSQLCAMSLPVVRIRI